MRQWGMRPMTIQVGLQIWLNAMNNLIHAVAGSGSYGLAQFSSIFKMKSCSCCEHLHSQNQKCKCLNGFIFGWCIDVRKFPWCISFSVSWYLRNTHGFFWPGLLDVDSKTWNYSILTVTTPLVQVTSKTAPWWLLFWHACGSNICTWKPYRVYVLQSQKFAGETGHQQQSRQSVMASEILGKLSLSSIGRSHNAWAFVFYGMFWLNQRVKDGRGTHAGIVERGVP